MQAMKHHDDPRPGQNRRFHWLRSHWTVTQEHEAPGPRRGAICAALAEGRCPH